MSWPRTLLGRLMLILFVGLTAAQALTVAWVLAERRMSTRAMMAAYVGADIASSIAMLDRLPAAERGAWLPRLQRPSFRLTLDPAAPGAVQDPGPSPWARPLAQALSQALSPSQPIEVLRLPDAPQALLLRLHLQDGTPVGVDLTPSGMAISPWVVGALSAQWALLAALCWWAVRQTTRPLAQLAEAANALAPPGAGPPLPETGAREVAQASAAFNRMRARIDAHLAERTQMLAAISHDLQTPITRMRLRAELLANGTTRDKLQGDLAQMQHLVEQGLAYARSAHAVREAEQRVDLGALLASLVDDCGDAGQDVQWRGGPACTVRVRPQALRRILGNLIDNAVKFAGAAEVDLVVEGGQPVARVQDRGPGIPAADLARLMQPFERLEDSRSRATGGSGLGLAIAQRLASACGLSLALRPRDGGGLVASVRFAVDGTATR